jgi:Mg2+ and Co2+ transporter CorA
MSRSRSIEDVEEQIYERRRWMSDMMHDYATAIAQRQGERINRLTLVSLIFLTATALTGFFGMNFDWMTRMLASPEAFFGLGLMLPAVCVLLSIAWLSHRGLIGLRLWPRARPKPSLTVDAVAEARPGPF